MEKIKVTPPQISEETYAAMGKFFLKTSIPRILKEREKEINENTHNDSLRIQR